MTDLDAIRALAEGATKGPWKSRPCGGCSVLLAPTPPAHNLTRPLAYGYRPEEGYSIGMPFLIGPGEPGYEDRVRHDFVEFSHADAAFLSAARNNITKLLDIAQAAKAMREATAAYVIETEKDVPEFSVNATNAATIREYEATAALDAALARLKE